ncbi:pyocin activator PrtN family protein [Escherichia coli]|nr:pyocin activator PrtN family protein [Escherichia coli]
MNTLFLLMAEFNTPNIELSAVSQKYFGMSPATAEAKANACKLPVPTYSIGTSQKAKRCINIQDLAEYIDKRREEGRAEWERVRTHKQRLI